jgi:hypothetical protein
MPTQFHEGDRVTLRGFPQTGTTAPIGTITLVFHSVSDLYEVQIDKTGERRLVAAEALVLVKERPMENQGTLRM